MEILEGKMFLYLDGKELLTSAGDPPVFVPRGHVHGFKMSSSSHAWIPTRSCPSIQSL
jgi:quercetin dioxygenase-like cupin family protein